MKKYTELNLFGDIVKKHHRDIKKDGVIKSHLPQNACRIFESSAGTAILARELKQEGHDVTISNHHFKSIPNIDEFEADLNKPLELPDESFDAVICREVIEHVESVPHTLREFNRILKPGGTLLLTFPNRLQIRSRFMHLLSGFYRGMKSPINLDVPFGAAHINLIGYPEMDYFLRHTGYDVTAVESSYFSSADKLLLCLRPLIKLTTNYYLLKYKKTAREHDKTHPDNIAYNTYIANKLLSTDLFIGKDVIVAARKKA